MMTVLIDRHFVQAGSVRKTLLQKMEVLNNESDIDQY